MTLGLTFDKPYQWKEEEINALRDRNLVRVHITAMVSDQSLKVQLDKQTVVFRIRFGGCGK